MRTEEGLRLRDGLADPPPDKQMDLLPVTALIEGRRYRRYGQGASPQKSESANAPERTPAVSLASLSPPRISRVGCRLLCADKSAKGLIPLFLDPSFSLQMQKERHSGGYRAARDGQ